MGCYKTSMVGKWHLRDLVSGLPNNKGFDSFYGMPYNNDFLAPNVKYSYGY